MLTKTESFELGLALACGATALATRSRSRNICTVTGFASAVLLGAAAVGITRRAMRPAAPLEILRTITINRDADDVYAYWRNLMNLPRVFTHLHAVIPLDEVRSQWSTREIAGTSLVWTAEITDDVPGALIAWRTTEDSDVEHEGRVQLVPAPGGRGTEVHVRLGYSPPAGKIGRAFAKLLAAYPAHRIGADLRRLKQILETGAVVRSDASIHRGMHPARPTEALTQADWRIA